MLNVDVRVLLLSISSKLSLVQMKLETEQQQENLKSMIHYWQKKKDVMTKLPKCQRTCRTGIVKFPALERTLKEWTVSQRENSRAVTTVMIRLKAKELAKQTSVADFFGGPSWCSRFMRRKIAYLCVRNNCGSEAAIKLGREGSELSSVCFSTKGVTAIMNGFRNGVSKT